MNIWTEMEGRRAFAGVRRLSAIRGEILADQKRRMPHNLARIENKAFIIRYIGGEIQPVP